MSDTEDSGTSPRPPREAIAPPGWVIVMVLAVGFGLVGGTTWGAYLCAQKDCLKLKPHGVQDAGSVAGPTAPSLPSPSYQLQPQQPPAPVPGGSGFSVSWQGQLMAEVCPSPCAGGVACTDRDNKPCVSQLSCIPGTGKEILQPEERWGIHLSAVIERDRFSQKDLDPCVTQRPFWLCEARSGICLSQVDACQHGGSSSTAIPVTGAQLDGASTVLDVRLGSPTGPLVARTRPLPLMARAGLCSGFVWRTFSAEVPKVTFYLRPR